MLGILLPFLAISGGQTRTVSFICRAEPLSRLVKDLSAATGLSLSVSKECAGDVLVVSANGVTPKALLDEIAKVDAGEWRPQGAITLFVADDSARRAQARAERNSRAKRLRANIAETISDVVKQQALEEKSIADHKAKAEAKAKDKVAAGKTDEDDDDGDEPAGVENSYASRLRLLQLLQTLDPDDLVLDPGRRIVFSSRPNQMQYELSSDADQLLTTIVRDHNEIVAKYNPSEGDASSGVNPPKGLPDDYDPNLVRIDSFAKADVSVEQSGSSGIRTDSLEATLRFYDTKGNVLLTADASVPLGAEPPAQQDSNASRQDPTAAGTPIEFSDESKQLQRVGAADGSAKDIGAQIKRIAGILSNPEHTDPLSFLVTDSLLSLAKLRHKPLVAVVPDGAFRDVMSMHAQTPTVEEFEVELATGDVMTENATGEWIELIPALPESARTFRADRKPLAEFAKACQTKGAGTLEDVAKLAQGVPTPASNPVTMTYLGVFSTSMMMPIMNGNANWEFIRIYGALSRDERQTLVSGGRLPLTLLGTGEVGSLVSMVYGSGAHLLVGNAPDKSAEGFFGTTFEDMPFQLGDYKSESTEVLPSGIPPGGWLEMTAEQQPCFTIGGPGEEMGGFSFTVGLQDLASVKAMSEMSPQQSGMSNMLDKLQMGSRTAYHLTFRLADGVRVSGTLNDDRVPKDGESYSLASLPDDVKAQLQKKVDELKKKMGPTDATPQPNNTGGVPPPG